jgi:hypothetical protein
MQCEHQRRAYKKSRGDPTFITQPDFDHRWVLWILHKWLEQNGIISVTTRRGIVKSIVDGKKAEFTFQYNNGIIIRPSRMYLKWRRILLDKF